MDNKLFYDRTVEHHHKVAIDNLAKSMNQSREGINILYAMVLRHYSQTARIKSYLSPLVIKRVKELLQDSRMPSDIEGGRRRSREF
jgi:hypothetical protein